MNRIDAKFAALAKAGRTALIPFVTAGHPHPDWTVDILRALARNGADLIEVGIPFSDPMADGPTIQRASEQALAAGMTSSKVLDAVSGFRAADDSTPIVLMGYLNPLIRAGLDDFMSRAAKAGADACLLVDCPPEECDSVLPALRQAGMHQIFLVAPTTRNERVQVMAKVAGGFVYYVALKGVTGAGHLDLELVANELSRIRAQIDLPLAVGFGIKTPEQARALAPYADAVVVGSQLVAALDQCESLAAAQQVCAKILAPMADAIAESDQSRGEKTA